MKDAVTMDGGRDRARLARLGWYALAATAAVITMLPITQTPLHDRTDDLTLIYVGAEDCAPCRAWQNGDGAEFRQSVRFAGVNYVEVKSPSLRDIMKAEHWPEPIRAYRDLLKRSDGVPLWLIVSHGKVIEQRFGLPAWRANILPSIQSALR